MSKLIYVFLLICFVSLSYQQIFGGSTPTFLTYSCANSQEIISGGSTAGTWTVYVTTAGSLLYNQLFTFNTTGNLISGSSAYYLSVYTGQYYTISNTSSLHPIGNLTQATCNQTLANYADEATRVFNLARKLTFATDQILYRNAKLDQVAQNYIASGSQSLGTYQTDSTATTLFFLAETPVSVVNPGAIIQNLIAYSGYVNTTNRELGVYYSSTQNSMAFVLSSRSIACGNGVLDSRNETCDDNNTISGDGCSSNCQVELNYVCTQNMFNETSVCTLKAGFSPSTTSSLSRSLSASPSTGSSTSPSSSISVSSSLTNSISRSNSISRTPSRSTTNSRTASISLSPTASLSFGASPSSSPAASSTSSPSFSSSRNPGSSSSSNPGSSSSSNPGSSSSGNPGSSSSGNPGSSSSSVPGSSGSNSGNVNLSESPSAETSPIISTFPSQQVAVTTQGSSSTLVNWMSYLI